MTRAKRLSWSRRRLNLAKVDFGGFEILNLFWNLRIPRHAAVKDNHNGRFEYWQDQYAGRQAHVLGFGRPGGAPDAVGQVL